MDAVDLQQKTGESDLRLLSSLVLMTFKLPHFLTHEELQYLYKKGLIWLGDNGEYTSNIFVLGEIDPITIPLRKLFLHSSSGQIGKASTKREVSRRITKFKLQNPEYTNKEILAAAEKYVKNYPAISVYLQSLDNFIENDKGQSRLLAILEDDETFTDFG